MVTVLTHKEIAEAGRLGKCLDSGNIPVFELRKFLAGIQQKASAGPVRERTPKKLDRKDKYKTKLRVA